MFFNPQETMQDQYHKEKHKSKYTWQASQHLKMQIEKKSSSFQDFDGSLTGCDRYVCFLKKKFKTFGNRFV